MDDPAAVDQAWSEELLARSEQVSSGTVSTVDWDQVVERVAGSRRQR